MTLQVRRCIGSRIWLIVGSVVAFLVLAAIAWWYIFHPQSEIISNQQQASPEPIAVQPVQAQSRMLFTGNIYWGRYMNNWSQASELKTAYPFSRLNEFNKQDYQAWIGGLECPLVAGVHLTAAQEEANLSFNCSPEYLTEAAKWFDVFTLANNHTDNQGAAGFAETKQQLDTHEIQYFGHYDPRVLDEICEVISIDTVVSYSNETTKVLQLPVALCGYHGVFRIPTKEALAVMEEYSKVMPVIAMPHAGAEYKSEPDQIKTTLYRSMIDHGADAVIGDHPHWIQSTEAYKGKLIVYSMGNFIFDQQFNTEVTRSAVIQLQLTTKGNPENLTAWTKIGAQCRRYHDSCLELIKAEGLTRLDMNFQYGAVGSTNKGRLAHPAPALEQQAILERLRWNMTMSGLQPPYARL